MLGSREGSAGNTIGGAVIGSALGNVVALEADVTVLSEGGGPGVTDEPVLSEGEVSAVSDELHDVVDGDRGVVSAAVEDSAVVEMPVGGIDVDGEGAGTGDGGHDGILIVLGELHEVVNLNGEGALGAVGAVTGITVVGGEGVSPLLSNTAGGVGVVVGELSSSSHAATGTSTLVGVLGAGGDLLVGEGEEVTVDDGLHGLHRLGSGLSPAISAHTLVLDGADDLGNAVTPVHGEGKGVGVGIDFGEGTRLDRGQLLLGVGHGGGAASVEGTALLGGPVGHVVEGHGPAALLGVVGKDLGLVLLEDAATGGVLVLGVDTVVLGGELLEAVTLDLVELGLGLGGESAAGHKHGGNDDSLHGCVLLIYF